MKKLMIGVAALALMTGCNRTDKPAEIKEPTLKELTVRTGNPANAASALAAMSLTTSGAGPLSFASSTTDGASATFTDLSVTGEQGLTVGSLVFDGLDMIDGKANFGKMSLNNIVISGDELDEDVDVKVGAIELVNPSAELAAFIAGSLNGQEVPFPAAESLVFDSWSINGLTGSFSDSDADGTFGIDKIEIRDMANLKAARAVLSGLSLNGTDAAEGMNVNMKLGSVSATNINAKFVKAIQENIGDEEALMSAVMDAAYENPMDPGYDSFKLDDLAFDVAGAAFAIPSLTAFVERNSAGQPVKYVTQPYTMTLKANAEGGEAGAALLQGLSVVGYEELTLKGESLATYDPDKDIVSFDAKSNFLELVDGATFSFGGKIEGYNAYAKEAGNAFNFEDLAAGAEPDPMAMTNAMGKLTFHNFELSIADNSLLDRAFNAAATSQGADPAELKSQIGMGLAMAPMMAQGSGVDMALVSEATGALSKFINDGGTLTLKIAPATPLSVASIMANPDPSAYTKDSLGFSAVQKK